MVHSVATSSDYIQEDHNEVESLTWDSEGVRYKNAFATWDQALGVFPMGRKYYVLVPRQPPNPPWLEVVGLTGKARMTFEAALQHQKDMVGYRSVTRALPPLSPQHLLERVIAREPIPGLLEIPYRASLAPMWIGGAILVYFLAVTFLHWAALVLVILALMFVVSGVRDALLRRRWFKSNKKRVLVLCPDGCVVGIRGGPRAFSWSEIGKFEFVRNAIVLRDRTGAQLVALQAAYFGAPLSLVCAVAESYRKRHQREQSTSVRVAASGKEVVLEGVSSEQVAVKKERR